MSLRFSKFFSISSTSFSAHHETQAISWQMPCNCGGPTVRRLIPICDGSLIDLDNGLEINSSRTQFMKRMVEFCGSASTDFGVGLLSALSQQIQPHRTRCGVLEQPLEWHAVNVHRNRAPLGPEHDLAWCLTCRPLVGSRLRQRGASFTCGVSPHRRSLGTLCESSQVEPRHPSAPEMTSAADRSTPICTSWGARRFPALMTRSTVA